MKYKLIALIIGIVVLLNLNVIYDNTLVLVSNKLLSEMSEEVGDDIISVYWGDELDYRIHYKGDNICLEYRMANEFSELLTGVYKYKIEKDNFYILSDNGRCVIDRSGNACVFLKNSDNRIESGKITYVSSEFDFGEIHREFFDYIENKIIFKNGI